MISYTKDKRIHPCYLTKSDLEALVDLIQEDFPALKRGDDFSIRTYSEGINVSEKTLSDLLSHKKLPQVITRLAISRIGWTNEGEIDKKLYINFWDNFIELSISGYSETWVNGKYLQVVNFLKKRKPFFWFTHTPAAYTIRGMSFGVMMIIAFVMWKKIFTGVNPGIWLVLVSFGWLGLDGFLGKHMYTKIILVPEISFVKKYDSQIVLFGVLVGIITIIGVILQIVK